MRCPQHARFLKTKMENTMKMRIAILAACASTLALTLAATMGTFVKAAKAEGGFRPQYDYRAKSGTTAKRPGSGQLPSPGIRCLYGCLYPDFKRQTKKGGNAKRRNLSPILGGDQIYTDPYFRRKPGSGELPVRR